MKIVFMGTPEFAVPCLEACIDFEDAEVTAVFTQPDRPSGRGNKLTPPPVKVAAVRAGIPVYQPERIKSSEAMEILKALQPDLIVVVAYGQILSQEILELPDHGCINVHASLLPRLRGASPIQWSIVSGETETGVTIMKMSAGLDEGDMLFKEAVELTATVTGGELHDQLMEVGAAVLTKTLEAIRENGLSPEPQVHELSKYAPKIDKKMAEIDWHRTADEISAQARGFDPWPAAVTTYGDVRLKLFKPVVIKLSQDDEFSEAKPGTIIDVSRDCFTVKTGQNAVRFYEIQAPGSRRMKVSDYLLGHRLDIGARLGA